MVAAATEVVVAVDTVAAVVDMVVSTAVAVTAMPMLEVMGVGVRINGTDANEAVETEYGRGLFFFAHAYRRWR